MRRRLYRLLAVGAATYRWRVVHEHVRGTDTHGRPRYAGCREALVLRRDGATGRIRVAFPAGAGLRVHDGVGMHSGGVLRSGDGAFLNLHRPGTVRALLEEALAAGHGFDAAAEIDGRPLIDAVLARLR